MNPFQKHDIYSNEGRSIRSVYAAMGMSAEDLIAKGPYSKISGFAPMFSLHGEHGNKQFNLDLPVDRNIPGVGRGQGVIGLGGSNFLYHANVLRQGSQGYYSQPFSSYALQQMSAIPEGNNRIYGIASKAKDLLLTSRSTVASSLGPDWSMAFHKSFQIDVNSFRTGFVLPNGMSTGSKTVAEHLSHIRGLLGTYAISGGRGMGSKEAAVQEYYEGLVGALEGQHIQGVGNLHISSVKDFMFRDYGILSTLAPSDVGFGLGIKQISKGIHQYAKLTPIDLHSLNQRMARHGLKGFGTPVATGRMFGAEQNFIRGMARFHGYSGSNLTTRVDAGRVAYALGEVGSNRLADSYVLGGPRMMNLLYETEKLATGDITSKLNLTGLNKIDDLAIHPDLRDPVTAIMQGRVPKGMKRAPSGAYMFSNPLRLRQVEMMGYSGTSPIPYHPDEGFRGVYLGSSVTKSGYPTQHGDVMRAAAIADGSSVNITGIKYHNGVLSIMHREHGHRNAARPHTSRVAEDAFLLGGTRTTIRATNNPIKGADLIARGADFGLELGPKGFTASSEFISRRIIPHLAAEARSRGRLSQFASLTGLGYDSSGYVYDKGGSWLDTALKQITSASNRDLENAGIGSFGDLIQGGPGAYTLNSRYLTRVKQGGSTFLSLVLNGGELAHRAGMVRRPTMGKGAFSVRLQETMPLLAQQAAGTTGKVAAAYQGLIGHMNKHILTGTLGNLVYDEALGREYVKGRPGYAPNHVGREIAGILMAPLGGGAAPGGALKGIKPYSKMTLEQWYLNAKVGGPYSPLARTREGAMKMFSNGGILGANLAGTAHSLEIPQSFMLDLPAPIQSLVGIGGGPGKAIQQSSIYMPSDMLLGSGPTEAGVYFSRSGGVGGLGLARQKATILSSLYEEMAKHEAAGHSLSTYAMSDELTGMMSGFASTSRAALVTKRGIINHYLKYQPEGAMRGVVGNIGALGIDDQFTVALHEKDYRRLLGSSGYSKSDIEKAIAGELDIYSYDTRHPLHSGQNISYSKVISHKDAARGRIYKGSGVLGLGFGDYDHDHIQIAIEKAQQENLKTIYRHRRDLQTAYFNMMSDAEKKMLGAGISGIKKNGIPIEPTGFKGLIHSIASRFRSAAGGGAGIGPVDMYYRRLTTLGMGLFRGGNAASDFISAVGTMDNTIAGQMSAFAGDSKLASYLGRLQEVGVYGVLKKGSTGFGGKNISVIEALAEYGATGSDDNLKLVRAALSSGVRKQFTEGNFKVGTEASALGLTADDIVNGNLSDDAVNRVVGTLLGDGQKHQGVATLARARYILKKAGGVLPIEDLPRSEAFNKPAILDPLMNSAPKGMAGVDYVSVGEQASYVSNNPAIEAIRARAEGDIADANIGQISKAQTLGQDVFTKGLDKMKVLYGSPWGKRIAIGGGALLGLGAVDALFGSSDSLDPMYSSSGGAPLPPPIPYTTPDQGFTPPSGTQIYNRQSYNGRIERPMGSRQVYNINATTTNEVDFGNAMNSYVGAGSIRPTQHSYSVDKPGTAFDSRETDYQIRRRLGSSF